MVLRQEELRSQHSAAEFRAFALMTNMSHNISTRPPSSQLVAFSANLFAPESIMALYVGKAVKKNFGHERLYGAIRTTMQAYDIQPFEG